jgi:hypothetical protein
MQILFASSVMSRMESWVAALLFMSWSVESSGVFRAAHDIPMNTPRAASAKSIESDCTVRMKKAGQQDAPTATGQSASVGGSSPSFEWLTE